MKIRGLVVPVCLTLGGILFALLALELVFRIGDYDPARMILRSDAGSGQRIIRKSSIPGLEYDLTPNARRIASGVPVEINSYGFRDMEFDIKKNGKFRIIALGDSLTFGLGIPNRDTFPKKLETYLENENPKVEVMNFGVVGYNTIDEAVFFEHIGLQFSPDLLVLAICVNDAGIYSGELPLISLLGRIEGFPVRYSRVLQMLVMKWPDIHWFGPRTRQEKTTDEISLKSKYGIDISTSVPDPTLDRLIEELRSVKLSILKPNSLSSWYESRTHIGVLEAGLRQISVLSRKHHFKVIPVIFPYLSGDNPNRWDIVYRIIEHDVHKLGFDFINLASDFRRFGLEKLQRVERSSDGTQRRDQFHFNELGHDIAARRISEHVKSMFPHPGGSH